MATLNDFIESEQRVGTNSLCCNARILKEKILAYARAYSTESDDHAAIYLYEKEAASLLELLTAYVGFGSYDGEDYYAEFKECYDKKVKRK